MEHNIGLALLSHGLQELYQITLPQDRISEHIQFGEHGKPFLTGYPDIHFNISNCDGLVVCALDTQPIGVDAEKPRRCPESVFRRLFTEEERVFFESVATTEELRREWFLRFWTLKESRIKQSGHGLFMPLNSFSFSFDLSAEPMKIICSDANIWFSQFTLESGYMISVCTTTAQSAIALRYPEINGVKKTTYT